MYPAVAQMNTRWTSQPGADPIGYRLITPPQIPDRSTELRRIDRSGRNTVHFLVCTTLSPLGPGRPPRMPKHKEPFRSGGAAPGGSAVDAYPLHLLTGPRTTPGRPVLTGEPAACGSLTDRPRCSGVAPARPRTERWTSQIPNCCNAFRVWSGWRELKPHCQLGN